MLLIGLIDRRLTRIFAITTARGVLWLANHVAGIKYRVETTPPTGPDVPQRADGKAIIAAKHMSILEAGILLVYVKDAFFIIKRELMWIPIYGWAFWRLGCIPVNRKRGATNMAELEAKVAEKITSGMRLIIFPEGTRVAPGKPVKLKRGLLFLAQALKLPIVPVGTDSGLYWPKRGRIRPGTATVWFEQPLPPNSDPLDIAAAMARHSV